MSRKLIKKEIGPIRHNHIYSVPKSDVNSFIRDCLSLSHKLSIETSNCNESFCRKKRDDISLNDALNFISNSNTEYYSLILRRFFNKNPRGDFYWEFCASGTVLRKQEEYFIWIEVEEDSGYKLVEKYKLIKNEDA